MPTLNIPAKPILATKSLKRYSLRELYELRDSLDLLILNAARKAKALPAQLQETAIRMISGAKQQLDRVFAELRNRGQANVRTSPEPDYPGETDRDTPTQEARDAWVDANTPLSQRSTKALRDQFMSTTEEITALQQSPKGSENISRLASLIPHGRQIRAELRNRGFAGNSETDLLEQTTQILPDRRRWPPNLASMFKKPPRQWTNAEVYNNMARLMRLGEEYEARSKDPQSKALLLTLMRWVQREASLRDL